MIITLRCVGIDVSKHHLDIFDEGIGVSERVANAPHAITESVARWRCDALVILEATGVYDLELRGALVRPTSASPGSILPGLARCPVQRPTRQDRPDRRTDARRLRARHAARHRAGLTLPETPWRDWQNGGIDWSSCEPGKEPSQ